MSPGLTSDLLPKIRIGSTAFYSSGEYMNVITGAEFFYTEAHYESFFKEQIEHKLEPFIETDFFIAAKADEKLGPETETDEEESDEDNDWSDDEWAD